MGLFKKLSLKVKLMLMLVVLTATMLSVYGALALKDFKADKIAYVFDANLSHSRSAANQIRSELDFVIEKISFLMRGYTAKTHQFHRYSTGIFPQEDLLQSVWAYQWQPAKSSFARVSELNKKGTDETLRDELDRNASTMIKEALEVTVSIRLSKAVPGKWLLALRYKHPYLDRPLVVVTAVNKGSFVEAFVNTQMQDTYLVNTHGQVIISPLYPVYEIAPEEAQKAVQSTLQKLNAPMGIHEFEANDQSKWLISAAQVGAGDLKVLSLVPKQAALEAVQLIMLKSVLFVLLLLFITVFVSVLSSSWLTATLKRLHEAAQRIGQGDFDVQVNIDSEDEIGGLARGFNHMATEIKRLLDETAEKARMESELQTASLVQSTLFPAGDYHDQNVEVRGFYEPASECGGDWWYYSRIGSKTYFWIGDATGHGVPAALVTSAARSAAGVIENIPELPLPTVMALLNTAIYGAAKGQVLMTFFVGCFNHDNNEFSYCNASHDPPLLFPNSDQPLKKRDVQPLMDSNGPRLGENENQQYEVSSFTLNPDDRIVFYTDGVTELMDNDGNMWGERKFIKSLLTSFNEQTGLAPAMQNLAKDIKEFRAEAALSDDITYFMFRYDDAA